MDNFHQGLDSRLQDRLDNIFPPPDNLDDLARLAVRLDRHMIQQIKRKNKSQHHSLGRNNHNKHNPNNNNSNDNNNEHSNHKMFLLQTSRTLKITATNDKMILEDNKTVQ